MPGTPTPHLSDELIDAYWKGRLSAADEQRAEVHYLDCDDCRARVAAVETLVDALRFEPTPAVRRPSSAAAWQAAAAALAIIAIASTWQWIRLSRAPEPIVASGVAAVDGAAQALYRVAIAPPTRSASAPAVMVPAGATIVLFSLDAREAGAPRTPFDAAVIGPAGQSIMRLEVRSTAEGFVEIPVHRGLLESGPWQFELTNQGTTMTVPLLVQLAEPRP